MASKSRREIGDLLAREFVLEASDRERMANKPEMTEFERRILRAQANIYRVCAKRATEEGLKGIARG